MLKLRKRKTDLPRTYFLYRNKHRYFLLFWLEFGIDGSIYTWFDDNPDNSWELVAKYSQNSPINGKTHITLNRKSYKIYDPHISWHQSGKIHVSGYNNIGKKGNIVISDKKSATIEEINELKTFPYTQIVFPTVNYKESLSFIEKGLPEEILKNKCIGILNKKGFSSRNNGSESESYFIIDQKILKQKNNLGLDLCIHHKSTTPVPVGDLGKSILHPQIITISKAVTPVAVSFRIFSSNVEYSVKKVNTIVATCFNLESIDLVQLLRKAK